MHKSCNLSIFCKRLSKCYNRPIYVLNVQRSDFAILFNFTQRVNGGSTLKCSRATETYSFSFEVYFLKSLNYSYDNSKMCRNMTIENCS